MSSSGDVGLEAGIRIYIAPRWRAEDAGEGGVRRVVEAQLRYLPALGFEIVDRPEDADVLALHSGEWVPRSVNREAVRVVHCHGLYWDEPQYGGWWPWARRRNEMIIGTFRKCDGAVVPCEWVANILRRDLWLDPRVIYNGIDLPRGKASTHLGQDPEEPYVLWNKARVDPVCEVDTLGALLGKMPDVSFVSTFAPKPWMDRAAALGGSGPWILENLRLTGKVSHAEAIKWVRSASVYLCTTREVFSVGVLEALSYGVPVVGYAWGGQREVIRHGVDGWLAPPGDVDSLAAGIQFVLAHWDQMSAAARARVRDFQWKDRVREMATYYRELLAERRDAEAPHVSVVIPCHNLGDYVAEAIESAIYQQVPGRHEVIVVDDASSDDSLRAVQGIGRTVSEGYSRSTLRTVELKSNRYLAGALDAGVEVAQGEYILNLDADNMLPDDRVLARMASALDDDEDIDVVYGGMRVVEDDGVTLVRGPVTFPPKEFNYLGQMRHENQVQSSAMYRRRVWERLRGYRQHMLPDVDRRSGKLTGNGLVRANSDADFWTRAATLGFKFKRLEETTLTYRVRRDSMSHTVPEYDWVQWSPRPREAGGQARSPMGVSGRVLTLEPVVVTVIVNAARRGDDPDSIWRSVESLWPQTFSNWECIVVSEVRPLKCAPYARYVATIEEAIAGARGTYILPLDVGDYLMPKALTTLVGAAQWSYEHSADDRRHRFVYSDWVALSDGALIKAHDGTGGLGATLFERSYLRVADPQGAAWGNWAGQARLTAGRCGQYVGEPLLVSLSRHWSGTVAREDDKLAGCGCGGRGRGSAGGGGGCTGPGCPDPGGPSALASLEGPRAGRVAVRSAANDAAFYGASDEPMVLMEYVGGASSRTFISPTRKRNDRGEIIRYHFGQDRGHRERNVYQSDVTGLTQTGQVKPVAVGNEITPLPAEMKQELVGSGNAKSAE